ncbi:hypothetical protein [Streptomyces beijiangensis]|uniref:Uncharacterized protein n=1 Tax=Streptomyces beijiangensis TaxID=163361 RepID=A0A939F3Y3_9ACTN|nr:hypothetical protein [Streptomyces beijiangensis]MBO0510612.1 hypothetical protein [Streptomyces beijiangensis]
MSIGQGGPSWGPGDTQTPDWAALAEESEARGRRRKLLFIGGGVLATAAIAGIVATAVVTSNKNSTSNDKNASQLPAPATLPSESGGPQPTFSSVAPRPVLNPKDFISSAQKDKAPLNAGTLFPGKKLTMGNRPYTKGATNRTTNCAAVAQGALGSVLKKNGCRQVIRATYVRNGVSITVGVAVFDTEAAALKAKSQASGGITPLAGSGVADFCHATVCLRRANSIGRYAYFTQGGYANGKKVTLKDKPVFQASDDLGTFVFNQIYARGRTQASAAATAPTS